MLRGKILWIVVVGILSCKNGEPQSANEGVKGKPAIEGLWISKTYVDSLAAKPSGRFNNSHGCTELYIKNNRVFVMNGEWQPVVCNLQEIVPHNGPVIYRVATYRTDSFVDFKLVNSRLVQEEPFHNGGYRMEFVRPENRFTEPENSAGFSTAFRQTTNQKLLAGTWQVLINSPIPPERGQAMQVSSRVVFYPDGSIDGLGEYKFYRICTEGDCKRYCDEMTLVYLSQYADLPGGKWYCWNRQGNRLEIFHAISKEWMSNWPDIQPYGDSWLVLQKVSD